MSGLQQRKVSWLCDEEWFQTYKQLFYGSIEEQWQALDTVNVWRLRFAGFFLIFWASDGSRGGVWGRAHTPISEK